MAVTKDQDLAKLEAGTASVHGPVWAFEAVAIQEPVEAMTVAASPAAAAAAAADTTTTITGQDAVKPEAAGEDVKNNTAVPVPAGETNKVSGMVAQIDPRASMCSHILFFISTVGQEDLLPLLSPGAFHHWHVSPRGREAPCSCGPCGHCAVSPPFFFFFFFFFLTRFPRAHFSYTPALYCMKGLCLCQP
jgi:hypothetical protein